MTCIVGFIDKDKVYMGGDSAGSSSWNIRNRKDVKVFKNGEFLIGYTSSYRMGQLLRFSLTPPKIKKGQELFEYMCTDFINEVISTLKNNKYAKIENNEIGGGTFLVGIRSRLFYIRDDFQVGELVKDYNSCGYGEYYAMGCLYALEDVKMKTEDKIIKALQAAEEYSNGVRGPFIIESI